MAAKNKIKTVFFCQECGYESAKWVGKCPACGKWNTMAEESIKPEIKADAPSVYIAGKLNKDKKNLPRSINEIEFSTEDRVNSGIGEVDRVLGGGIVRGSMVLVGGDPGIGKSTLLLEVCMHLAGAGHNVLYVSGEESLSQIKLRADRLGVFSDSLKLFCETDLDLITEVIGKERPELVVIDSIQTMFNESVGAAPGSVSQIRETTAVLLRIAKDLGITIFIIGHVTKEGAVAGPRILEHMVDTVLYFEGDSKGAYRILRSVKNRFGSTDEIGVFEMDEKGLTEVLNPSEYLLSGRPENAGGSVVSCCMEGTRPLLIEIQALVCDTAFGFPRRQASGTDLNKVNLLMAVLEKRAGLKLSSLDAYVNLAGGIKVYEPALDLAICFAIASSYMNRPLEQNMVAFGEVGLSGEVRSVTQTLQRINEAKRLGFETVFLPYASLKGLKKPEGIKLVGVRNVKDVLGSGD